MRSYHSMQIFDLKPINGLTGGAILHSYTGSGANATHLLIGTFVFLEVVGNLAFVCLELLLSVTEIPRERQADIAHRDDDVHALFKVGTATVLVYFYLSVERSHKLQTYAELVFEK